MFYILAKRFQGANLKAGKNVVKKIKPVRFE